jgi:hypothetical protein
MTTLTGTEERSRWFDSKQNLARNNSSLGGECVRTKSFECVGFKASGIVSSNIGGLVEVPKKHFSTSGIEKYRDKKETGSYQTRDDLGNPVVPVFNARFSLSMPSVVRCVNKYHMPALLSRKRVTFALDT